MNSQQNRIAIAISKGRIIRAVQPLLEAAEINALDDLETSRKLVFETRSDHVTLIVVRSTDVPTYVRLGGADFGIVGKDVLLEIENGGFYELVDLGVSRCQLVVAQKESVVGEIRGDGRKSRIATKYENITRRHFAAKGINVDVMRLGGSMELAPLCGLADRIVDLSQSGATLHSNGLKKVEVIAEISARLIANKASMRLKEKFMKSIAMKLEKAAREYSK